MADLYHNIYTGEIFQQSQCIWHENTLMDFFRSALISMGYHSVSDNHKVYQRGEQKVVICLVDDFTTCSTNYSVSLPYLFDTNTVVITDNHITVPTQYRVLQLPSSFFGIYRHQPKNQTWNPQRRYNFSVNRLDYKRMLMMLEIWSRCMWNEGAERLDFVNFNCWAWGGDNETPQGARSNFEQFWNNLEPHHQEVYQETYNRLVDRMPWRNHDLSHEDSHVSAWVNLVMETYSSDTTVAFSEKIFRALCLPVPWIVYSGRYAVSYLHSLGFDVMHDVIRHDYDGMIETKTAAYGDKMVNFVFEGSDFVDANRERFPELKVRCEQAAAHNQRRLETMAQQWPSDFAAWWAQSVQFIA